jgi:hypothetical protein
MRIWTYTELKTKVQNDLDMASESFVVAQEWIDLFNEAVDEAEAEIHRLYEDYFLTKDTVTLVDGTAEYALPSDIYANKIRALLYSNGSRRFPLKRYSNANKFEEILEDSRLSPDTAEYKYYIDNPSVSTGYRMVLVPTPGEAGAYITRWYLRNAFKFTGVTTERLDIPEFANFVMEYVKAKIRQKENGGVLPSDSAALVEQQREMMIKTLTTMVPDADTYIPVDTRIFQEHT